MNILKRNKTYKIKEIFYSIQGEGFHSGTPALFIRFTGCNLWSGKEEDKHKAICRFCDTDFLGTDGTNGGIYSSDELIETISQLSSVSQCKFIILTGGEPLLQLDEELISAFKTSGYYLALETNGTIKALAGLDWITVSPKAGTILQQTSGNELKLVYPQKGLTPSEFEDYKFEHFYLQAKDDKNLQNNIKSTLKYCLDHPKWKLSLQLHKILNIQ